MSNFFKIIFFFFPIFIFSQESSIEILGKTNVSTFKCTNNDVSNITINLSSKTNSENLPEIAVPVKDFTCGNKLYTKDFQSTLKASEFPNLNIKFLAITKTGNNSYRANIEVTLMNRKRNYLVDFLYINHALSGLKTVKFSEFGLIPPKKMGGLITVNDALNLTIILKIK